LKRAIYIPGPKWGLVEVEVTTLEELKAYLGVTEPKYQWAMMPLASLSGKHGAVINFGFRIEDRMETALKTHAEKWKHAVSGPLCSIAKKADTRYHGLYEKAMAGQVTEESVAALREMQAAGLLEKVGLPPFMEDNAGALLAASGGEGGVAQHIKRMPFLDNKWDPIPTSGPATEPTVKYCAKTAPKNEAPPAPRAPPAPKAPAASNEDKVSIDLTGIDEEEVVKVKDELALKPISKRPRAPQAIPNEEASAPARKLRPRGQP
jgi:hypothetical protein